MVSSKSFKIFRKPVLGIGSYGEVHYGIETTTGTKVAVKKSRASLRLNRTLLQYEARVLHILNGHPSIPLLHAYGRHPHFEYIVMELGGDGVKALAPTPKGTQLKTVILLAKQMIFALEHVHSRGFVHRDVKADHMLISLRDPTQIILIDFGITRPQSVGRNVKRYDPETDRRQVMGTLKWASLNAHHGFDLSWRDDLESLAYVLLFLLRGNLPWQETTKHSTDMSAAAQVRMAKTKWSGSMLSAGYPPEFGQLLDESRALNFDDIPDYSRYIKLFDDLHKKSGFNETDKSFDWSPAAAAPTHKPNPPATKPLAPGSLVSARLLAGPTILGLLPDDEFWEFDECHNKSVSCKPRPAVVLESSVGSDGRQRATLAALVRGTTPRLGRSVRIVPGHIEPIPPFEFDDMSCYVFLQPISCVISDVEGDITYRVREQELAAIQDTLVGTNLDDSSSLDEQDRRIIASIEKREDDAPLLVHIRPLHPAEDNLDWTSERAWFDDIAYIRKERAADDGWCWTSSAKSDGDDKREELSNSYGGWDISNWDDRQQEREGTLTLAGLLVDLPHAGLDIPHAEVEELSQEIDEENDV